MNIQFNDDLFNKEEIENTPKRYQKYQEELKSKREYNKFTKFINTGYTGMIVQRVEFHSTCAHHLLPFFGVAYVGYIPNKTTLTGFSKLARAVDKYASKPQSQEQLSIQVVKFLQNKLKPKGVMVVIKARHLCMECRGVKKSNSWTVTSELTGLFKKSEVRMEFFELIKLKFMDE